MGRYLALQHIRCSDRDILIVRGAWQDHFSSQVWHAVENESVPPSTTVCAGSLVEYDLPEERLQRALSKHILAEPDANYHFDLDRVFDMQVSPYLHGKEQAGRVSLADELRAWGFTTMEAILANEWGEAPLTEAVYGSPLKVRASDFLKKHGSAGQLEMWLRAANNIVGAQAKPAATDSTAPDTVKELSQ